MKLFKSHRKLSVTGLALVVAIFAGGAAYAFFSSPGSGTGSAQAASTTPVLISQLGSPMYNSTVANPADYNYSQCFYCVGMGEFGNRINLAGNYGAGGTGPLTNVTLAMANFNTTSGPMTMTLKIFNAGSGNTPGSLIGSKTQTFFIPATSTGYIQQSNDFPYGIDMFNITFNFTSQNLMLPGSIVYELQYKDPQNPITAGVNVQLSNETTQVSTGSSVDPGHLFLALASTANGDGYTAGGQDVAPGEVTCSTGSTSFLEYSTAACLPSTNGYGTPAYVPAIEFDSSSVSDLQYPGNTPVPVNFSLTNNGSVPETVNTVTIAVANDSNVVESIPSNTGSDVAGCYASWFDVNGNPSQATVTVNQTIPAGHSVNVIGQAYLSMPQSPSNQNACQGASIGLSFTSN